MNRLPILLVVTFIESLATIYVERGIYFFGRDRLGFSDAENLWLALAFGVAYVVGALSSHPWSLRVKEKPLLVGAILGQVAAHLVLAAWPHRVTVFVGSTALAWLNGLKWPILETYVSAGRTPASTAGAIGRFNVAWASAVPVSLATAGPIIAAFPTGLFLLPAGINLLSALLLSPLPTAPAHLPADHPARPDESQLARLRALLAANRWLMLSSYAALFLLAPLMPRIFQDLGFGVASATALSGVVDLVRLGTFVGLGRWRGWHSRLAPVAASALVLPGGFLMVLSGHDTAVVLAGEAIFGLAAGATYYAALYYVMVVKNAAVDAGGGHEGLIGLGFAVGPLAGLAGTRLAPAAGSLFWGTTIAIAPVFLVCAAGALLPILKTSNRPLQAKQAGTRTPREEGAPRA